MSLSNEALRLADLGYRVFPCVPGEKRPLTEHGCLDATTDENQICEWWSEHPDANIGISTDGLVVVDIDPMPDGSQNTFGSELEEWHSLLSSAGSVTPRGGTHCWFCQPPGAELRNTASKISRNVDTRANGGYVLAPPSRVDSVGQYTWMMGFELNCSPNELAYPPEWLMRLLSDEKPKVTESINTGSGEILEGGRNMTLTSLAGYLRRAGLSYEELRATLLAANMQRCKPPLPADEVNEIASNVSRYEPDQITQATAEGWHDQDVLESRKKSQVGPLPKSLLWVPGLIGDIISWNAETAYKAQPELAIGAALALMATITGRKVEDKSGTRTNLYAIGVCNSGRGKEHARQVNKRILQEAGMEDLIGPEDIASSAGLISAVNHQPAVLLQIDEIGRMLKTTQDAAKSPHLYGIITVLLRMYSASNALYIGPAYADAKKVARIDQPHACLYATSVPKSFMESLSEESLTDGFISRLLVFESSVKIPNRNFEAARGAVPSTIVQQVRWWGEYNPGGNLQAHNPRPRCIQHSADATTVFRELEDFAVAQDGENGAMWSRSVEKAVKLAMLWQMSADCNSPEITKQAAEWARDIVTHLTMRMVELAEEWVSSSAFDSAAKRVLRTIAAAGEDGISLSHLKLRMRFMKPREQQDVINDLVSTGQVFSETVTTKGRPKVVYKTR